MKTAKQNENSDFTENMLLLFILFSINLCIPEKALEGTSSDTRNDSPFCKQKKNQERIVSQRK